MPSSNTSFHTLLALANPSYISTHNPFPKLPVEIREQIYTWAYTPTTHFHHTTIHAFPSCPIAPPHGPPWLPAICAVHPASWVDAGLWFIRNTEFAIEVPTGASALSHLAEFLDTFPAGEGWQAVRRVYFSYFDHTYGGQGTTRRDVLWRFLAHCPNVREITLQFRVMSLLKWEYGNKAHTNSLTPEQFANGEYLRPLRHVLDMYAIDGLLELELERLGCVYLDVWPTVLMEARGVQERGMVTLTGMPVVEEVAGYLRRGFRARCRDAKVVVRNLFREGMRWRGE